MKSGTLGWAFCQPNERYLCLAGAALELEYLVGVVEPAIEALKAEFFEAHSATSPIIFHRKELFAAKRPFAELKIGDAHDRFNTKLLSLLSALDFTLILVIIDKYAHTTARTVSSTAACRFAREGLRTSRILLKSP
jgi:hypothetical protein